MSHPLVLSREKLIRSVCVADPAVSDVPAGKPVTIMDENGEPKEVVSPLRWVRADRCTVKAGALVVGWKPLGHNQIIGLQGVEDQQQMLLDASAAAEEFTGVDGIESVEDLRISARIMLGAHIFNECSLTLDPTEPAG